MVVANNEIDETKHAGKSTTISMAMAMQGNPMQGGDMGMMQQVRGDPMYME